MTESTAVAEPPQADPADEIEFITDVSEDAETAIGIGCGDDNPYR